MVLENIEPKLVWDIFENVLAATPRCSKKEEKIRDKIKSWVKEKSDSTGIKVLITEDDAGNILIKKPATPRMESCPSLLLQAHVDMVCETDRSEGFDFENNGIPLILSEDKKWVEADGTTLGGDDGIGVALALAVLFETEDSVNHGPLEVLLTVDEETGLTGAKNLDVVKLGIESKLLINLDTEFTGMITIGCAGGGDITLKKEIEKKKDYDKNDVIFVKLQVSGLLGGHSGVDINKPRANSNQIISRCLSALADSVEIRLSSWSGGNKRNAISREAVAKFMVNNRDIGQTTELLTKEIRSIVSYYEAKGQDGQKLEPEMSISWEKIEDKKLAVMSSKDTKTIVYTAVNIPHGVYKFSPALVGLVEGSLNFAVVKTTDSDISIWLSSRNNVNSEKDSFLKRISQLGKLGGWKISLSDGYPGWTPDPTSPFLKIVREEYERELGREVLVGAIHAGLETGIIGDKIPGLQMVSIGSSVLDGHTPKEKASVEATIIFYRFFKKLLKKIENLKQ